MSFSDCGPAACPLSAPAMSNNRSPRVEAIHAVRLLNDFVGDLVVGARIHELVPDEATDALKTSVNRMCLSYLALTLSKFDELRRRYAAIIPKDLVGPIRDLRRELDRRKVIEFRNTVVGHIWDKKTDKALTYGEIDRRHKKMIGGDLEAFLSWINSPDGKNDTSTVVGLVELLRDGLIQKFSLKPEEWLP